MRTPAIKMLVVLAAVVAFLAICQFVAWTPAAKAAVVCLGDPNDPNAPEVAGALSAIRPLAADPNDPNAPEVAGALPAIRPLAADPNDPNAPEII